MVKLNTNIETKKLYDQKLTKSDIYIEFTDNSIIGISIKSKKSDFLTNYSIEKIFTEINIQHDLKNIRIDMVLNKFKKKIYPKSRREEANEMFYNKNNKYYSEINNILNDSDNMKKFVNIMKKYLFKSLLNSIPLIISCFSIISLKGSLLNAEYLFEELDIDTSTKTEEDSAVLPTNPLEIVEMIRRQNSMNDATNPSDAIDDALKSFNTLEEN